MMRQMMNWKMLDLAVRRLNVFALKEWKSTFLGMSVWMQAILVGALVLLIGVSALSCWWGIRMKRSARFAAGAVSVFYIVLIILVTEYSIEMNKALIFAALAGAGAGFLYAFLERIFQLAAGFVFGTVLSAWLLPTCFHMKMTSGKGRIWALVIAIAAGVLFALAAKKLKFLLTALEGGVVLGLLCDAYLPVNSTVQKIPWIKDKLTQNQVLNLLPLLIAATGALVQLIQLLSIRAEQKALAIPTGEERDLASDSAAGKADASDSEAAREEEAQPDEETISMVQAEEVLVEKAKELALAAARSAEQARLKERYEDVAAGLYSAKIAAGRLDMSEEAFTAGMKRAGYSIPGEEAAPETEAQAEAEAQTEEAPEGEEKAEPAPEGEEKAEAVPEGEGKAETTPEGEAYTDTEPEGGETLEEKEEP